NHLAGEKRWLRALLSQTLFGVLLRELNFVLRKRRFEHNFSEQIEDRVIEPRQCRPCNDRVVGVCTGGQAGAHARDLVSNLPTRFRLCAFRQKTSQQIGESGKFRRIESAADAKCQTITDKWQAIVL